MHQKRIELGIGKENCGHPFESNRGPPFFFPSSIYQNRLQFQSFGHSTPQKTLKDAPAQPQKTHHGIHHIPPFTVPSSQRPSSLPSNPSPTPTHQTTPSETHFQNEPFCSDVQAKKNLLSTPQKRPVMSQTPSKLSHSPTLRYLHHGDHNHDHRTSESNSESCHPSFLCPSSFAVLPTKTIALNLIRHSCRAQWLQVHLRFFFLLSLLSLYFFTSSNRHSFFLHFLSIVALSVVLVISFSLARPRLPSFRLLLARSFPIKISKSTTATIPHPQVVWSIGSLPKSERRPDSGAWVLVYSNGDVYEGEFHKGKCSGSGVYYYHMCGRYEGDWVDEKYHGHGVETWAKGSRYRGQYRQGLRHGFGVYRFYTADVYAGEWCNGQCHGFGIYTCKNGSRYLGEFKWGVKHGLGKYHFRNGDAYAGEYFSDKAHGFGVYHFANGHRYEGAWHEGRRQGLGMYTFRYGEIQSGHWQNGVLDVSSIQEPVSGSPPVLVDHARVLCSVKEAQQAAGKAAVDVVKVDERVNRALAAANKAANAARVAAVKAVQNQIYHNTTNAVVPISS